MKSNNININIKAGIIFFYNLNYTFTVKIHEAIISHRISKLYTAKLLDHEHLESFDETDESSLTGNICLEETVRLSSTSALKIKSKNERNKN